MLAQENSYIGVAYLSRSKNNVMQPAKDGAPGYYGAGMERIDLIYKKDLTSRYDVQLGVQYSYHVIEVAPNVPPGTPALSYETDLHLISLPVLMGVNFWKICHLHGGPLMSVEVAGNSPIGNQTGLGLQGGIGVNIGITQSIRIFTLADFRYHSIISLGVEKAENHLIDNGLSVGVLFMLP